MDSTTILCKVDDQHNKYFTGIYDMHLQYKLCRDQNLIQYAFYVADCETKLFYFNTPKNFINALTLDRMQYNIFTLATIAMIAIIAIIAIIATIAIMKKPNKRHQGIT